MKILTVEQLKNADQKTIEVQGISSLDLMERASSVLFEAIKRDFDIFTAHFTIICGKGNNGGDGLALARMLHNSGGDVDVFLLKSDSYSNDNLENQKRLPLTTIYKFDLKDSLPLKKETIIIDALFGYGLSHPLDESWAYIISQINKSEKEIISIDMPSGLLADSHTPTNSHIIIPNRIYTFHCPKTTLLLPENAAYSNDFKVLEIGLVDDEPSFTHYTNLAIIKPFVKKPNRFSHKGTFGHALIIGGSLGKMGAVCLSSKAALKTGCGLVSVYVPKSGLIPLQSSFPEAMVMIDENDEYITKFPELSQKQTAVGIGVGLGTDAKTINAFSSFLKRSNLPYLVLDADAINILALHPELVKLVPKQSILTPHPKELSRLIGEWSNDFDKIEKVKAFTKLNNLIVVIKGANSVIVLPEGDIHFNSTGNYGMATAGSGDVLTGIITSLLVQGYTSKDAVVLGVFLHGLAADEAIKNIHPKSLVASDIINHLNEAWKKVLPYTTA